MTLAITALRGAAQGRGIIVGMGELGRSIFAGRTLLPNEEILPFYGSIISFDEAVKKGELESYALQIDHGLYIDTCEPGCFVNHSCEPNAGVREGKILVALRRIERGEEIRFDYSTTMDEDHWTMLCSCGAAGCRGIITDFKYLSPPRQEWYLRRGIVQPFIAARYEECVEELPSGFRVVHAGADTSA